MKKVRMLVLQAFTRNLDGGIVVGEPDHPNEEDRYIRVSPAAAAELEEEGLAEPYSEEDEIRDRISEEERAKAIEEGDPDGGNNLGGASTAGIPPNQSSQAVVNARTNTGGSRRAPRSNAKKTAAVAPGRKGGAPAGGHDTNATTNNPTTTVDGDAIPNAGGAVTAPDPDAPPAA